MNPRIHPAPTSDAFDWCRTPIGVCGVCVGARGVRRVLLPVGGGVRALERALRRLAPDGRRDRRRCRASVAAVSRFFRGGRPGAVRLDLSRATSIERAIYAALRRVPPGRVLSYSGLARRIGRPRAARAVGRALGRNPLPLLIPCHRVVRADGTPGGFSCAGGVKMKQKLLALESLRACGRG